MEQHRGRSPSRDDRGRSPSRGPGNPPQGNVSIMPGNLDNIPRSLSRVPSNRGQQNISILPSGLDNRRSPSRGPGDQAQQNISRMPPNLDNRGRPSQQNVSVMPPNLDNRGPSPSRGPSFQPHGNFSRMPQSLDKANPAAWTYFKNPSSSSSHNNQYSQMPSRLDRSPSSPSKSRISPQNQYSQMPSRLDSTQSPPTRSQGLSLKSTLTSAHDIEMASRQTNFSSLPPVEQQKQDKWARNQLHANTSGCPGGVKYIRTPSGYPHPGYICALGVHLVTDELLREGFGLFYVALVGGGAQDWIGPFNDVDDFQKHGQSRGYIDGRMGNGYGRRR